MKFPWTFSIYLGRQFLLNLVLVFSVLAMLILVFDALELFRRAYAKHVPLTVIGEMVIMRLPFSALRIAPFAVLIGGILTFSRLTRTTELIVARASGISIWQFLFPTILLSFLIGSIITTTLNPLSSAMLSRFEKIEAKYLKGNTSLLSVSSSGLWLREKNNTGEDGKTILYALRVSHEDMTLYDVTVFIFGQKNKLLRRVDAEKAILREGYWEIENGIAIDPGKSPKRFFHERLGTTLSSRYIQDSFASPETLSFWELPKFIATLKEAGFSALRHALHFHSLTALPFLLSMMVFVAATFSLRPPRQGKTGLLLTMGILSGLGIYFLSDLIAAIGLSGRIPIPLAAWTPVGITTLLGAALMFHLEDG